MILMKQIQLGTSNQKVSSVILGCMRINGAERPERIVETAFDNGINFLTMRISMVVENVKPSLLVH